MCESSAYLVEKDGERLLLQDVVWVKPQEDGTLLLMNMLGEKKELRARIDSIDFLKHRLLLRPLK